MKSTFQLLNSIEGSEGYQEYEEESGSGSHFQLVGPRLMHQDVLQECMVVHYRRTFGREDVEPAERKVLLAGAVRGRKEVVSELL